MVQWRLTIIFWTTVKSKNSIASKMRACWSDPFSTSFDPRSLLMIGADEIDRLQSKVDELENKQYLSKEENDNSDWKI